MPKCAIFADTQDEPRSVYTWLDWLEKQLPFPVHRVTKGRLSDAATTIRISKKLRLNYTNSNVPAFLKSEGIKQEGKQMRQCTKDFKIDVILREVRRITKPFIAEWRKNKELPPPIIQWIGISRDEIVRMKPSRVPYIAHRWPLIDAGIRRSNCIDWMKAHGYPEPPRSACVYCPYHSDREWRRLKDFEPEEFEKAAQFEESYQVALAKIQRRIAVPFLHRSLIPLRQVDFSTDEDHGQQVMFGNECEGMCGV